MNVNKFKAEKIIQLGARRSPTPEEQALFNTQGDIIEISIDQLAPIMALSAGRGADIFSKDLGHTVLRQPAAEEQLFYLDATQIDAIAQGPSRSQSNSRFK